MDWRCSQRSEVEKIGIDIGPKGPVYPKRTSLRALAESFSPLPPPRFPAEIGAEYGFDISNSWTNSSRQRPYLSPIARLLTFYALSFHTNHPVAYLKSLGLLSIFRLLVKGYIHFESPSLPAGTGNHPIAPSLSVVRKSTFSMTESAKILPTLMAGPSTSNAASNNFAMPPPPSAESEPAAPSERHGGLPPLESMRAYRACLNCRSRKSKCYLEANGGRPVSSNYSIILVIMGIVRTWHVFGHFTSSVSVTVVYWK